MKKLNEVVDYISDKEFSNSLKIKCTKYLTPLFSRVDALECLSKEKRIVHLGCCDHLDLIEDKMKDGVWLHARLQKVSKNLVGIDINDEAISFLHSRGISDIIKGDITSESRISEVTSQKWDLMIAAEIVEHINNPVEFLSKVRQNYKEFISEIVITVPNAFSFNNFRYAFFGVEAINTDHRYWFTPYTISKVLYNAGFSVEEIMMTNGHNKLKLTNFPRILISKVFPMFRDTLIVRAKF